MVQNWIPELMLFLGQSLINQFFPTDSKRMLPSSFQPSSSSSRPVKDVGSTRIRETYGNPYAAHTWQNHSKAHVEDTFSRASNDMMKDNHHGIRILPPSMKPHIPPPSYGGPSDIYRPTGVVDEQAVVDERHIYQVALQVFMSPSINCKY